jgi:hypothetical protein
MKRRGRPLVGITPDVAASPRAREPLIIIRSRRCHPARLARSAQFNKHAGDD